MMQDSLLKQLRCLTFNLIFKKRIFNSAEILFLLYSNFYRKKKGCRKGTHSKDSVNKITTIKNELNQINSRFFATPIFRSTV